MKHQKHNQLARPETGHFGRREWALLGAPCGTIQQLARDLAGRLGPRFRTAYVDADHAAADAGAPAPAFTLEYTDKINFQRLDFADKPSAGQQRAFFNDADLVLINGNHFAGARQLVILDRRKFDSLARKVERLTQVDAFLHPGATEYAATPAELPSALKEHLPHWADIPVLAVADMQALAAFVEERLSAAPLQALLLAGGKSQRMGQDKALLDYHGVPQWQHLLGQAQAAGAGAVFLSCRADQAQIFAPAPVVTDTFLDLGPMGAILSAFRQAPDSAWLVLACDLPLLDTATIRYLIEHRNPSAVATAFRQPPAPGEKDMGFPEPLISIWEPRAYPVLLQFLAQGISCPRKVLINAHTHLLDAPRPQELMNANTPAEREMALEHLYTNGSA